MATSLPIRTKIVIVLISLLVVAGGVAWFAAFLESEVEATRRAKAVACDEAIIRATAQHETRLQSLGEIELNPENQQLSDLERLLGGPGRPSREGLNNVFTISWYEPDASEVDRACASDGLQTKVRNFNRRPAVRIDYLPSPLDDAREGRWPIRVIISQPFRGSLMRVHLGEPMQTLRARAGAIREQFRLTIAVDELRLGREWVAQWVEHDGVLEQLSVSDIKVTSRLAPYSATVTPN